MNNVFGPMIQGMLEECRQVYDEKIMNTDPMPRLEEQLRALYGKGEIDREHYRQLRLQLHWGMISKADLHVIHQNAVRLSESRGVFTPWNGDPELERGLDRLYSDQVWVEETHDQLQERFQALKKDVDWMKEQANLSREDAAKAMPDEASARRFLQVWQRLLSLSQSLEADLQIMKTDIQKLDILGTEIKASITRIKFFQSQEQVARLDQQILGDLLVHR